MLFHSQEGQDKFLHEQVFKGFRGGVFVDVGAHDGVQFNNTLFFEQQLGWTGVNVEPLPDVFRRLQLNRPHCTNVNTAISSRNGREQFMMNSGYTEMLSGLCRTFNPSHKQRVQRENNQFGGQTRTIEVESKTLESVLETAGVSHVHYLSVDVEGGESEVIRSINFDKVFIDVIQFENNYSPDSVPIVQYLVSKGFKEIRRGGLDIFMLHQNSQFA